MDIRKVRMTVAHLRMVVNMAVWARPLPLKSVFMLVVLIVNMPVCMGHRHVLMLMSVTFGEVKPHANTHQDSGHPESSRHRLAEEEDRNGGAEKGGS